MPFLVHRIGGPKLQVEIRFDPYRPTMMANLKIISQDEELRTIGEYDYSCDNVEINAWRYVSLKTGQQLHIRSVDFPECRKEVFFIRGRHRTNDNVEIPLSSALIELYKEAITEFNTFTGWTRLGSNSIRGIKIRIE